MSAFGDAARVWPALLVAGVAFAVPQFLISNFHGPWLVEVGAAVVRWGRWCFCLSGDGARRRSLDGLLARPGRTGEPRPATHASG